MDERDNESHLEVAYRPDLNHSFEVRDCLGSYGLFCSSADFKKFADEVYILMVEKEREIEK